MEDQTQPAERNFAPIEEIVKTIHSNGNLPGQTEEGYRTTLSVLKNTLEATDNGILVAGEYGKTLLSNRRFSQMWHLPEELVASGDEKAMLAFALEQLVSPQEFLQHVEDLYENPEAEAFDVIYFKDGRVFERASYPMMVDGKPAGRVWSFRDITRRMVAEEALRRSEERLSIALGVSNAGIWEWNVDTGEVRFDARFHEILGYQPGDLPNNLKEWKSYHHPDDLAKMLSRSEDYLRGRSAVYENEHRIRTKSGKWAWVYTRGQRVNFSYETPGKWFMGIAMNITKRKQTEEVLRLNARRVQALLKINQMTDANLQQISDYALEEAVRLTESELGYLAFLNEDETILTIHSWSKGAMAECSVADRPVAYVVKETGLWGEAVRQRQAVITNDYEAPSPLKKGIPSGHVAIRRHMNVPIFEGQKICLIAGVGNKEEEYTESDVQQLTLLMEGMWRLVDRLRTEEQLAQYREHLEELVNRRTADLSVMNRELEAFSYSVSHDLRAPLRTLDGFSQLILEDYEGQLDDQGKDYLRRIRSTSQRMSELIDDLLKLSRISRAELREETVDMSEMAGMILEGYRQNQPERQVECVVQEGIRTRADRRLLRIALENLLGNAWKFTSHQPVSRIEFGKMESKGQTVYFVRDNGVGFEMAYAEKLFAPFQRLHSEKEYPGSGIGLSTVQRIIQRHGGQIWAESELNQGATFYFTLSS